MGNIKSQGTGCACATHHTIEANQRLRNSLPPDDGSDFERAKRGFIGKLDSTIIRNDKGEVVWDMDQYAFLAPDAPAPETVNPSLWRQAKLNTHHGLFKVCERIYQVRGYDISNITFVQGDTGWIVIDPCCTLEVAHAAYELVTRFLGERKIKAVLYTHSHIDHFGGAKGIVSEEDVAAGHVKIIAPEHFTEETISENVYAGNAMGRRASYMFGNLLPSGERGFVDAGLGKHLAAGESTLILPTVDITRTGQTLLIDGVEIVFQLTPGTEAPAEMNFHFPQFKALCMAENTCAVMHNLYTLRGAKIRDARAWSTYINEAIELFGAETDVMFISHHWPRWGREDIVEYLKKQRDVYRYIHDQTLRLANHGYTMVEIAEMMALPKSLDQCWSIRGYYGTVNHNSKAVYQRYLGWFDANPANLHPLPPVEAGKRYVDFMGGADALLSKARDYFEKGEYRWVAQVVNHLVFADPDNRAARELQAAALEQLGYQAESGPWRNFYLTGAMELREGVQRTHKALKFASMDYLRAMPADLVFDYWALRLNGPKAEGKALSIKFDFHDDNKQYVVRLENSVLNHSPAKPGDRVDATVRIKRHAFNEIQAETTTFDAEIASGSAQIDGRAEVLSELLSLFDTFDYWFDIVTP